MERIYPSGRTKYALWVNLNLRKVYVRVCG